SLFSRDVFRNVKKNTSDKQQLLVGKIVIPIIAILAYLFAQLQLDLIAVLSVASSAGLIVIVPAIIGAFFWKKGTAPGVIISITVSSIVVILIEVFGGLLLGLKSGLWGIMISLILFIGISLLTKAPADKANEFIDYIKRNRKNKALK